jgi:fibronectin-binding autotransporter adhesin
MTGTAGTFGAITISNSSTLRGRSRRRAAFALAVGTMTAISAIRTAHAATLFWDADGSSSTNNTSGAGIGGNGNWTTAATPTDWWNSSTGTAGPDQAWVQGDQAEITGAANSMLTLVTPVTVNSILSYVADTIGGSGSNDLTLSGTVTIGTSGKNTTISAPIAGSGFSSTGSTLVLSGTNIFTGTYTLNSGQVNLNNAAALGNSTFVITGGTVDSSSGSAITLNNNAETWNGNFTFIGTNNLNTGTGAISLGSTSGSRQVTVNGGIFTVGGTISNGTATSLTKAGAGTMALTGANLYTGGTILNAGTLTAYGSSALGATTGSLAVNNPNTGAGTNVVLNLSTTAGTTTGSLSGTISTPSSGTNTATINMGGQLFTVNQTTTGAYAGVIAGSGGFTLGSSSTALLTLSGVNTFTGGATVNAGTLALNGANTFTGGVTVNGGTLDINNSGTSSSNSAISTGTLTLNGGSIDSTVSGVTLATNNAQTWSNDFTFVGSQSLNLGTGGVSLGTGAGTFRTVTVNANTLTVGGVISAGTTCNSLNKAGAGTLVLSGSSSLSGSVNVSAGSLVLSGSNVFTGGVTVVGGTLDINNALAIGPATLTINGGNIDDTSGSDLTVATNNVQNWNGDFTFVGTQNLNMGTGAVSLGTSAGTTRTVTVNANALTVGGVISNGTTVNSLTKAGLGTLVLTGAEAYTGATVVNGGTLSLAANGSLSSTALVLGGGTFSVADGQAGLSFTSGTTINSGASAVVVNYSSGNTVALGAITRNPGGAVDFTLPSNGSITTTNANVLFPGGQQTILGGYATVGGTSWAVTNTVGGSPVAISALPNGSYSTSFTAAADVDAVPGTDTPGPGLTINSLRFNTNGSYTIADSGGGDTLTIATGGVLETSGVGGNSVNLSTLNLTSGNGTDLILIQDNTASPMTVNSNIIGNIGLTKVGTGALVLAGSNTYTGATYLGGSGSVTQNGPSNLNLSSANNITFTGGLTINAGQLTYSADNNLGASISGVTLNGAPVNFIGTSAVTNTHVFTIGGSGATFNIANGVSTGSKLTFSTANQMTGSGTVTKTGPGWLSLGAANNISGNWTINAGVVETVAGGIGASTTVTINGDGSTNPATAGELAANNTNFTNNVFLAGGIVSGDNGNSTYSGATFLVTANSTIRLGDFADTTNRSLTITSPLTSFSSSVNLTLANSLSGIPTNSFGGATNQLLTLTGNNGGYSGSLTVDGGHGVVFTSANSFLSSGRLIATNTTNAIPIIGESGFDLPGNAVPTTLSTAAGNGSIGVLAFGSFSSSGSDSVNLSTLNGGGWYLGALPSNSSYYGTIIPGVDANGVPTYRLGGGGGTLFLQNVIVKNQGITVTNVIIGANMIGGTGDIHYASAMTTTGTTTINGGSELEAYLSASGAPATNAVNPASALILNGGTFALTGKASTTNSQTINGLTVNPGGSSSVQDNASTTANPALITLGAITRNVGGTVDFVLPTGTQSATNGITTTTANTGNTILGGWATVGGTNWAVSAGNGSTAGLISALTTYTPSTTGTTAPGTTADVDFQASNSTGWGTQTINSLRFNTAGGSTLTLAGTLTVATGGILETNNVGATGSTVTGGTLEGAPGSDLIVIQNNTNTANGTLTISSTIADNTSSTGLTKSGVGTLILASANTFTGTTNDNTGAILLGNSLALQNSTLSTNVVGGTIGFGTLSSATLGGLSGNQYVTLTNSVPAAVALSVGNNNTNTVYSGNMMGLGSLTKIGTGTLTLSGSSGYSGNTTVNAGTLRITGTLAGTGAVSVASGATLSGTGTVTVPVSVAGGATTATQGNISLLDGGIGTLTLQNGLTVGDTNPASLSFDINATTADIIALGSSVFTVNSGGANIHLNSLVPIPSLVSGTTYTLMTFGSGAGAGFATGSGPNVGSLTYINAALGVSGSLIVTNTAVQAEITIASAPATAYWSGVQGSHWTDTNAAITQGNFTTDAGGTNFVTAYPASTTNVIFAASGNGAPANLTNTLGAAFDINSLSFTSTVGATNIGGTNTLQIEGGGINIQNGAGAITISTSSLVLGTSQTWTNASATPLTVSSNVSGSGLTTVGNVVMTGTNNYSGGTTVSSGTLQLGGGGSLNSTGNLTVNGTLDMNGSNITFSTLSGSGIITNGVGATGNSILTSNANADSVYTGVLSDSGAGKTLSLVKNGSNSLTLSGGNSYTGSTTLNAGILVVGNATALGNGASLTVNGGTLDLEAAGSGSGGPQTISVGSLSGLAGVITDNNGVSGVTTLNVNQTTAATYAGAISDGANRQVALSKSGTATLTLASTSSYSGGTTITAGKLISGVSGALGSGPVTLSGGTLSLAQMVSGFGSNGNGWTLNQTGTYSNAPTPITANVLTLTDNTATGNQGRWAFFNTPQTITDAAGFTASFVYSPSAGTNTADGIAFVLENDPRGANIKNGTGGSLGVTGTADSGDVVINLYQTGVTAVSQTGYNANGGDVSNVNMATGGINLHNGSSFLVSLSYSGNTLSETVTDQNTPADTFTTSYSGVDFQSLLGGTSGYVGFTGSDGGSISSQTISNFSFASHASGSWSNSVVGSAGTSSSIELGVDVASVGSLTIQAGATVTLTKPNPLAPRQVLSTGALNLSGTSGSWTGKLDLTNNDLDVQNGNLAAITNQVAQGFHGGTWNGNGGIVSSTAAANTTHLTALGVIQNSVGSGSAALYSTFDGLSAASTDVLVKYTYYGDANLNGVVDGSDYSLIDNGYLNHLTGWYNGDFNYDGVVDGSDYTLIDNAFNSQGASLAAIIASPDAVATAQIADGVSGVPEPTSLTLLGIAAAGLLGRRRRRH